LTVAEQASRRDGRDGVLVDIARDGRTLTFLVARSEPGPIAVDTPLTPRSFFRGHLEGAAGPVSVRLLPAGDPVAISIAQSYRGLRKDFDDQFKEHPGQGYLHYMSNLRYKLALKPNLPVRAVVRYGLTDHPKSFKEQAVILDPKKPFEIHDVVKGDDFLIDRVGGKLVIPPLNLEVAVREDRANGPSLGQARYTFRMIPPEEYNKTEHHYDPIRRILTVLVIHLARDKATGPVNVVASIGGQAKGFLLPRSSWASFEFSVPPSETKVRW